MADKDEGKKSNFVKRFVAFARGLTLPVTRPTTGTFLVNLGINNLDTTPIKTKEDQLDSYVGWVYACVSKIAGDLRANPRSVWLKGGPRREDWNEIPWASLPPLFRQPNTKPNQNTWGKMIELRNIHKDTTGEAWWHLLTATPGGKIHGIEMIQPDHVDEPEFNANHTEVTGWWVNVGEVAGGRRLIDARDLILDFYPNPRSALSGASPIEAFALAHHLDIYMRAYALKMTRDGASIGQYVRTDMSLSDDESEGIESRLNRKFKTPGRFAVLSKGAEVKHVPLPMRDLDMLRILRPSRDQIFAIYGVPASKFGLTEGAGDTNQKVADKAYQENVQLSRLMTFDEIMNEIVMPRVFTTPEDVFYESESPVEVDREWEFDKAERKLKNGTIKVNQFLQEIGDEDLGPDGEVYFIPSDIRVVKSLAAVSETDNPEDIPEVEPEPEPESPEQIEESVRRIALLGVRVGVELRHDEDSGQLRKLRRAFAIESFLRNQEREERTLKSNVRSTFSKEQREVKRALRDNESQLRVAATWPRVWETNGAAYLMKEVEGIFVVAGYDTEDVWLRDWLDDAVLEVTDEWNRVMVAGIGRSVRTGWGLLQQEVAGALDFNVFEQKASEFARRTSSQKIQGIQSLSIGKVRDVIRVGIEEGQSIDAISKNLDGLYDQFKGLRAETIARTETAMSVNFGKYSAASESKRRLGMDIRRNWLATEDDRTRVTHWNADSDRNSGNRDIDVDSVYQVGAAQLKHPGDSNGPPGETINCRCTETFRDAGLDR